MIQKLKPMSEFNHVSNIDVGHYRTAQAIPIAISPILTRIYTPEDFGIFAIFIAIAGIYLARLLMDDMSKRLCCLKKRRM